MDTTNRKGQQCVFNPMLCQEGFCSGCQIAIDAGNQAQDVSLQDLERIKHEAEGRRRPLEWKLNFRG